MGSVHIDFDKALFNELMTRLENGRLDREGAMELRQLLVAKRDSTEDVDLKEDLSLLIDVLVDYIAGLINLMRHPDVKVSNVR